MKTANCALINRIRHRSDSKKSSIGLNWIDDRLPDRLMVVEKKEGLFWGSGSEILSPESVVDLTTAWENMGHGKSTK